MFRKAALVISFLALAGGESLYFMRQLASSVLRLRGQHAFFESDFKGSLGAYRRALSWGGDRQEIETETVEVLLFGLDQLEAGLKVSLPSPPEDSTVLAARLIARRIRQTPFRAYDWSLASDIYQKKARQRLRSTGIDLATLSENPLENLLPEDWLSLSALEIATRLEPNNYMYYDLLVERFLEIGSVGEAARFCRLAVAAFPALGAHAYLLRFDLAPEVIEAAVHGFDDAAGRDSMIPRASIESEAGRLLKWHSRDRLAEGYFRKAVALEPELYDAQMELGIIAYARQDYTEALARLKEAERAMDDSPSPYYYSGLSRLAIGDLKAAIEDLRQAREKGPGDLRFYHALGEALERSGQYQDAERQFLAGTSLNPKDSGAWEALLAFYVRRRNLTAAYSACTKLLELNPSEGVYREQCASLGVDDR